MRMPGGLIGLQSPDVAASLRRELSLAGSGAFSCQLDTTIQPVVIVGDTKAQRTDNYQSFIGGCFRAAGGAATYNRFLLAWYRQAPISRIEITRLSFGSSVAGAVYAGWATPSPVGTNATLQSKTQIIGGGAVQPAGAIFDDNSAVAPVSSEYALRRIFGANAMQELDYSADPWVITTMTSGTMPGFVVVNGTANADLHVIIEWRELLRP